MAAVTFKNKVYVVPTAAASISFDANPEVVGTGVGTVLIVGESTMGSDYTTNTVYEFTSSTQAQRVIGGGPGYEAVRLALGNGGVGASTVLFVKSNTSYASVGKIYSSVGTAPQVSVSNASGGVPTGTQTKVSISVANEPATVFNVLDINSLMNNINSDPWLNRYLHATIQGSACVIKAKVGAMAETGYLVVKINDGAALAKSGGAVGGGPALTLTSKLKGSGVKLAYSVTQPATGYRNFTLYMGDSEVATIQEAAASMWSGTDLANAINGNSAMNAYVVATPGTGNVAALTTTADVSTTTADESTDIYVPFLAQPDLATTETTFDAALAITQKYDKNFVTTHLTNSWVYPYVGAYCSSVSEYRCQGFLGLPEGNTNRDALNRAASMNSGYLSLVYGEPTYSFGKRSSGFAACQVAGLIAGYSPQVPITNKSLTGLESLDTIIYNVSAADNDTWMTETQLHEKLLSGGVLTLARSETLGYYVVKGINTIQNQNNRQILGGDNFSHELSIMRIVFQIEKDWAKSAKAAFPGTSILSPSASQVKAFTANYLARLIGTLLVDYDSSSLSVSLQGDAWVTRVSMTINSPVNFAFFDGVIRMATIEA